MLVFTLVRWGQRSLSFSAYFSSPLRQCPQGPSTRGAVLWIFLHSGWWEHKPLPAVFQLWWFSAWSFWMVSLASCSYFKCTCWSGRSWRHWSSLEISLSLCSAFCWNALRHELQPPWSPWAPNPVSSTHGVCWAPPGFPSLGCSLGTFSRQHTGKIMQPSPFAPSQWSLFRAACCPTSINTCLICSGFLLSCLK